MGVYRGQRGVEGGRAGQRRRQRLRRGQARFAVGVRGGRKAAHVGRVRRPGVRKHAEPEVLVGDAVFAHQSALHKRRRELGAQAQRLRHVHDEKPGQRKRLLELLGIRPSRRLFQWNRHGVQRRGNN